MFFHKFHCVCKIENSKQLTALVVKSVYKFQLKLSYLTVGRQLFEIPKVPKHATQRLDSNDATSVDSLSYVH